MVDISFILAIISTPHPPLATLTSDPQQILTKIIRQDSQTKIFIFLDESEIIVKKLTFCYILQNYKTVKLYYVRKRFEEKAIQVFIETVRANKEMHNKEDC